MQVSPEGTTLLFTDIEGSTLLWEKEGERMSRALAGHDALSRAAVERNRGIMVKMTGDGMYAAFADPVDALNAALALQQSLEDPKATNGISFRVRYGLHLGIVERREDDLFGSPVNRAARIMKAAHGGQILLSQAVVDRVGDSLSPPVSLRDLGSVRLRDLATSEHVYQLIHPELRQDFPALRSLEATPNNLPQQVTSFIGRGRELTEIKELLESTRLLTLLGMGGLGKTRLSLQIGADVLEKYPDGVWFVDLAPIKDPSLVPNAAAQVLGLREEPGKMHIRGEQTYQVLPLKAPDAKAGVETLLRSDAVQLFVERARLQKPCFALNECDAPAVAELCARLDGIPLAIELAAARMRSLSIGEINARLHDRFKLLTGGSRVALERQLTLRALVTWSYDLLHEREQMLLDRLSVFAGGFDLPAAEAICGTDPLVSEDVVDLLSSLVDKSLTALRLLSRYRQVRARPPGRIRAGGVDATPGGRARQPARSNYVGACRRRRPGVGGQVRSRLDALSDSSWLLDRSSKQCARRTRPSRPPRAERGPRPRTLCGWRSCDEPERLWGSDQDAFGMPRDSARLGKPPRNRGCTIHARYASPAAG